MSKLVSLHPSNSIRLGCLSFNVFINDNSRHCSPVITAVSLCFLMTLTANISPDPFLDALYTSPYEPLFKISMTLYPPNRFWPLANAGSTDGKGLSPEEGSSTTEFPTIEDCLSMASKDSPTAERTTID